MQWRRYFIGVAPRTIAAVSAVSVVARVASLCACQSRTHITVIALYEGGGQRKGRSLQIGPFLTRAPRIFNFHPPFMQYADAHP